MQSVMGGRMNVQINIHLISRMSSNFLLKFAVKMIY